MDGSVDRAVGSSGDSAADREGSSAGVIRFFAWLGPAFTAMWLVGAGPVTHWTYILPPSAASTAAQTLHSYQQHLTAIRVGCAFMIFASVLYAFWGMSVSMVSRRSEGSRPILFYTQVVNLAACVVVVMFIGFFWGVAAFRPGAVSPEITQALNDLGWFGVLFTGAPFAGYQIALAAATLRDRAEHPAFPRWTAYFNLFVSVFMVEASLILFFKTGPFSQNGVAVFYLPMIAFFVWICTMSYQTAKAVRPGRDLPVTADAVPAPRLTASA